MINHTQFFTYIIYSSVNVHVHLSMIHIQPDLLVLHVVLIVVTKMLIIFFPLLMIVLHLKYQFHPQVCHNLCWKQLYLLLIKCICDGESKRATKKVSTFSEGDTNHKRAR